MTDHPIIFSAPMVRALLAGRKTMTRRLLYTKRKARNGIVPASATVMQGYPPPIGCPDEYWTLSGWQNVKAGDRLWVREAAAFIDNSEFGQPSYWQYRADTDGECLPGDWPDDEKDNPDRPRWRPCIHMPRDASRLTLIVTAVKIERLWNISKRDCEAEGVEFETADPPFWYVPGIMPHSLTAVGIEERGDLMPHAVQSFRKLWIYLHGREGWDANPFVVAPTFRVVKANIDAPEAAATRPNRENN